MGEFLAILEEEGRASLKINMMQAIKKIDCTSTKLDFGNYPQ